MFKNNTIQFNAINRAEFLNISHRFDKDPVYGEIMRRHRKGKLTKNDMQTINSRFIKNSHVSLPPLPQIRCACYMNDERNAYNNVIFLMHIQATHQQTEDKSINCPYYTCIIKATMTYQGKALKKSMYNRILDDCGDSDVTNDSDTFVDPALKFFHNIPLMMNTNEQIDKKLANGTLCRGLYIHLKTTCNFRNENWEGYMVNTMYANEIDYLVCMHECNRNYFLVNPETRQCKVRFRMWNNMVLKKIRTTYLPINCNISTTGHKLQGITLDDLDINLFTYKCTYWAYVVLSRVRELDNLILNQKLDIHH